MVLEKINQINDIQNIEKEELPLLAEEIRQFLIEKISVTGGHLASNLGVVELTNLSGMWDISRIRTKSSPEDGTDLTI